MEEKQLAGRHIVLLGAGHTNAHIIRMWRMNPIPDTDLTCISDFPVATYSGMLPAVLAGQVPKEQMEIDLVRLCSSVGARLIVDRVTGLDHTKQEVQFAERPPIPFDVLSIGIGSVPMLDGVVVESDASLKIKPMQTFLGRLEQSVVKSLRGPEKPTRITIAVVGSGVAGIEIMCCLPPFLQRLGVDDARFHLVTRSQTIAPELTSGARSRIQREMGFRGYEITTGRAVTKVTPGRLCLDDGSNADADVVIWATGATAPDSLERFDTTLDHRGFIATNPCLQSVNRDTLFAVGDSGSIQDCDLPKAGVYAVRQGPILWENISRVLDSRPLQQYKPQRSFLKLINLGNGRALGQWKSLSYSGRWAMKLKNSIDVTFMEKYQPVSMVDDSEPMQCRGCGCKLGATALSSVVESQSGLPDIALEDAAEIGGGADLGLVASTDFFSSPFEDAFLAGRVAALHSASDIIATGATATEALANVVLPEGDRRSQQRMLQDFLDGARREFKQIGARIVGGHTIVGPRMEAGFTVVGRAIGDNLLHKRSLREDDRLYLTKPLGIGVLLAAHMRSSCKADDYIALIQSMLSTQHQIAKLAVEVGLTACTDVTGFGLAGHLLEMLATSHCAASIRLQNVPLLSGSQAAVESGIESSLIDENLCAAQNVTVEPSVESSSAFRLLFDPQTCGGLLFGVPASLEQDFVNRAHDTGLIPPIHIGEVHASSSQPKPLRVF